jgi:acetyl-CoA acetyltransferase
MGLANQVAIIGTGTIRFGENFHQSYTDMVYEAASLAMADAGVEPHELQAGWFGTYVPFLYGYEGNAGTFVGDTLGLPPIPITRVAAYCASGMEAVRNAALAVASGEYDLVVNYEDLGFAAPGEGHKLATAGVTRLGGGLPVNASGGLKSCGHPVGASGVRMINNVADQLLGRAGRMQVPGARTGLAHTLGGPGAVSCVAILGQP